jgi:transglutaminase-like putative cysteine protease
MTDALAALGVLAVVSTASLGPWTNAVLVIGLAIAIAIPESWQGRPTLRQFATVAPLVLLITQGARLLAGHSPLDVAVEFAALLQIVRLATRRGAAHDQQVIVLSLLHFVAGTVLGGGLTYGLCLMGFLVVAPGALVLSHLRREVEGNYRQGARDRTGLPVDVPRILRSRRVVGRGFLSATCLLSVPILLFTTALFILFPRIGLSLLLLNHPRAGRMIGFSEHVDLGEVGVLRDDPTIALRFEVKGLPDPPPMRLTLRLRGTAFDEYDGRAWARTHGESAQGQVHDPFAPPDVHNILRAPDYARDRVVSFDLEPIDPPVVFLPPRAAAVHAKPPAQVLLGEPLALVSGAEDELRYTGSDARGLRYDVFIADDRETFPRSLDPADVRRHLELPPLPDRIFELAHKWTDALPTPEAKAAALEDHLRREYIYDLHSSSQGKPQPVDHFLFESRRGHCEFFSTAMAVMLRMVGIPSRNVTGFVGGTWNRFGHYYAVREGDAHSWVEAFISDPTQPRIGMFGSWRTFDPTPPSGAQPLEPPGGAYYYARDFIEALSQRWNTYVVGYDLRKQVRLLDEMTLRYHKLRRQAGVDHGLLDKVTRGPMVAGLILALMLVAYLLWRRYQRRDGPEKSPETKLRTDPVGETAAVLYRTLEAALQLHGIGRAPSVPPLRHAHDLGARQHPLAPEVESLTHAYLEVRFGGIVLTEDARRDFERRVRQVKAFRPAAV